MTFSIQREALATTQAIPGFDGATTMNNSTAPNHGYAVWDAFTSLNFTGATPTSTDNDVLTNNTLASTMAGGMLLPTATSPDNRIYSGSGPTPNAFNLAISGVVGTVSGPLTTLTLVLKYTTPNNLTYSGLLENFFDVKLNNIQGTGQYLSTDAASFNAVHYTWTGLNLTSGSTYDFIITSPENHVSIDAIALIVPEPSRALLIVSALGAIVWTRRRRQLAVA